MREKERKVDFYPKILILYLLILCICIISSFNTKLPPVIKLTYIWYSFENLLVFIYIVNNVKDNKTAILMIVTFLASALLQSFLAIGQYASGSSLGLEMFGAREIMFIKSGGSTLHRVVGTLAHPNALAKYLAFCVPITIALLAGPVKNRYRILLGGTLIIIVVAIVLTLSRGGMINAFVGGTLAVYICLARTLKNRFFPAVITVILIIVTIIPLITLVEPIHNRFLKYDYKTAYVRIPLNKLACNMVKHNPLLGVGLGSFRIVAHHYDNTREAVSYGFPAPVHNEFLLVASELGLPSLILFLVMIYFIFMTMIGALKEENKNISVYMTTGLFCSLFGMMVHLQVDYQYIFLSATFPWFQIGFAFALIKINKKNLARRDI